MRELELELESMQKEEDVENKAETKYLWSIDYRIEPRNANLINIREWTGNNEQH